MTYLKFKQSELINLDYSLDKEILRSNRAGSYTCTTVTSCNTRKYHGLMVAQMDELDGDKHMILSSLDVTVIQHGAENNLALREYPDNVFEPQGHKYIKEFEVGSIPKTVYRVAGVRLLVERLMVEETDQLLIKYTLLEANSPTRLRFKPLLGFRSAHTLTVANDNVNRDYTEIKNGVSVSLYEPYPSLNMQFSKDVDYNHSPDWFYNVVYHREKSRGYHYTEDLFKCGEFELDITKGESIIFSAKLRDEEKRPKSLSKKFDKELKKRAPRDSFKDCMNNASEQFIVNRKGSIDLIAGYPWYSGVTTQTMLALPGIFNDTRDRERYKKVLDTQVSKLKNGLFPKHWGMGRYIYESMDASLYFFTALQNITTSNSVKRSLWKRYGDAIKEILNAFRDGTDHNIKMACCSLIHGGDGRVPLTWMDSIKDGDALAAREGYPVEVNALWYNAICYSLDLAKSAKDSDFIKEWEELPNKIKESFINRFWDENRGYLADVAKYNGECDWTIRPNMVVAVSLPFSPVDDKITNSVLSIARRDLVTSRGLRSLSPRADGLYVEEKKGIHYNREVAMHRGAVHPWLLEPFIRTYLRIHGKGGLSYVKGIMSKFEDDMTLHCIGTISEMYEPKPPHSPFGAISQAWSVGAISQILSLIENFEEK